LRHKRDARRGGRIRALGEVRRNAANHILRRRLVFAPVGLFGLFGLIGVSGNFVGEAVAFYRVEHFGHEFSQLFGVHALIGKSIREALGERIDVLARQVDLAFSFKLLKRIAEISGGGGVGRLVSLANLALTTPTVRGICSGSFPRFLGSLFSSFPCFFGFLPGSLFGIDCGIVIGVGIVVRIAVRRAGPGFVIRRCP